MSEIINQNSKEAQDFKAPHTDNVPDEALKQEIKDPDGEKARNELDQLSLDSAIEHAESNPGDMNVEAAQITAAYDLGIPADEFSKMNAEEKQNAIQEAIDHTDDKKLLQKLRSGATGKILKLAFAAGSVFMAGSAITGEAQAGQDTGMENVDDGDQEKEDMINWPQIQTAVTKHLGALHDMGITQGQGETFLQQAVDSAKAVQDNGGSTQEALDKIDQIFEQQYDASFYSNPDNFSELKGFQSTANDMMERAAINVEGVSDNMLNGFQDEAWDWADHCVKNDGNDDTFKAGLQKIYDRHIETNEDDLKMEMNAGDTDVNAETEIQVPFEVKVKGFQSYANDLLERASIDFGDNVTAEQIDEFQTIAWSYADYCATSGGEEKDYKAGVKQLYGEHFSDQIEQQKQDRMERAIGLAAELAPEACPADADITDDWLRENVGKSFSKGDTLVVVVDGSSKDLQTSMNKANIDGRNLFTEMVANARGHDTDSGVVSEHIKHAERGKSAVFKGDDGVYHSYIMMEIPLSKNIK